MARRIMGFPSFFKPKEMWACAQPKTESFRMSQLQAEMAPDMFRRVNSVYVDSSDANNTSFSELTAWFESDDASTSSSSDFGDVTVVEDLVRGLTSERFFFEPEGTKSIVEYSDKIKKPAGSGQEREAKMISSSGAHDRASPAFKENENLGFGPGRKRENGYLPLQSNPKVGGGLLMREKMGCVERESEKPDRVSPFKEDGELGFVLEREMRSGCGPMEGDLKRGGGFLMREKIHEYDHDHEAMNEESVVEREWSCDEVLPFKGSLMMVVESENPFMDFKVSMEEMVEAHGLRDWNALEEMLMCFLRMNGKSSHRYIVGAFVDILINLVSSTSPPHDHDEEEEEESDDDLDHEDEDDDQYSCLQQESCML